MPLYLWMSMQDEDVKITRNHVLEGRKKQNSSRTWKNNPQCFPTMCVSHFNKNKDRVF